MLLNRVDKRRYAVIEEQFNSGAAKRKTTPITIEGFNRSECERALEKEWESEEPQLSSKSEYVLKKLLEDKSSDKSLLMSEMHEISHTFPTIPYYGTVDSIEITVKVPIATFIVNDSAANTCILEKNCARSEFSREYESSKRHEFMSKIAVLERELNTLAQKHGNVHYVHCQCNLESSTGHHEVKRTRKENLMDSKVNTQNSMRNSNSINYNNLMYTNHNPNHVKEESCSHAGESSMFVNNSSESMHASPHLHSSEQANKVNSDVLSLSHLTHSSSFISYHEYLATMHESITKMMEIRTKLTEANLSLLNREVAQPFYVQNVSTSMEEADNVKAQEKEGCSYNSHHTISWLLSDHKLWKDVMALLAIENERLILFIYANSEMTRQYLSRQMINITQTELTWISNAVLLEEPRAMLNIEINPVVVMWNFLTHLPLTHLENAEEKESHEPVSTETSFAKPFLSLPVNVVSSAAFRHSNETEEQEPNNINNHNHNNYSAYYNNIGNYLEENNSEKDKNDKHERNFACWKHFSKLVHTKKKSITGKEPVVESAYSNVENSTENLQKKIQYELQNDFMRTIQNINLTILSSIPMQFTSSYMPTFRLIESGECTSDKYKLTLQKKQGDDHDHSVDNSDKKNKKQDDNIKSKLCKVNQFRWKLVGRRKPLLTHFISKILECLIEQMKLDDFEISFESNPEIKYDKHGCEHMEYQEDINKFSISTSTYKHQQSLNKSSFMNVLAPNLNTEGVNLMKKHYEKTPLLLKPTRLSSSNWLEFLTINQRKNLQSQLDEYINERQIEINSEIDELLEIECEFSINKLRYHRDSNSDNKHNTSINNNSKNKNSSNNGFIKINDASKTNLEKPTTISKNSEKVKDSTYNTENNKTEYTEFVNTTNWGANFDIEIIINNIIQENIDDNNSINNGDGKV